VQDLNKTSKGSGTSPLFALLHPDPWLPEFVHVRQQTLISLLIWQALEGSPEISENTGFFEKLQLRLQRQEWLDDDCTEQYDALTKLISEKKGETYIILDRLDSCDCPLSVSIPNFLRVLGEASSVVKIFTVISGKFDPKDIVSPEMSRLRTLCKNQQRWKKH
jgi:hypothetical protein